MEGSWQFMGEAYVQRNVVYNCHDGKLRSEECPLPAPLLIVKTILYCCLAKGRDRVSSNK